MATPHFRFSQHRLGQKAAETRLTAGQPSQYVNTLKLPPQHVPGEITRRENHLLPQAAMQYATHMAFQKSSFASRTVNF